MFNSTTFLCAQRWMGPGATNVIDGCKTCNTFPNAEGYPIFDGQNKVAQVPDTWFVTGAVLVKPGCHFYGWEEYDHTGDFVSYPGSDDDQNGAYIINNKRGHYWDGFLQNGCNGWGFGAISCRCDMKLIECDPSDDFVTILGCDNTQGQATVECSVGITVGTKYTNEVNEMFSISEQIQSTISSNFFDMLGSEISTSSTTGYNWGSVSAATKSEQKEVVIKAVVEPGVKWIVKQVVGFCGGHDPRTDSYIFEKMDVHGKIVSKEFFGEGFNAHWT